MCQFLVEHTHVSRRCPSVCRRGMTQDHGPADSYVCKSVYADHYRGMGRQAAIMIFNLVGFWGTGIPCGYVFTFILNKGSRFVVSASQHLCSIYFLHGHVHLCAPMNFRVWIIEMVVYYGRDALHGRTPLIRSITPARVNSSTEATCRDLTKVSRFLGSSTL